MILTYELHHIKDTRLTKNNVFLIFDKKTKKAAVVDPSYSLKHINKIIKCFGYMLDTILITHSHPDHTSSVDALINQHGCDVYISRKEVEYYSYRCKNMQMFEDQQLINVGDTIVKCLLTPGHTAGSACFLLEKSLFSGDTIFMEGCGICSGSGASAAAMFDSIMKIKEQVSDTVLVYSGHTYVVDPGQSIEYLKRNNIYFNINDVETFVSFRMRKNQKNLFTFQ